MAKKRLVLGKGQSLADAIENSIFRRMRTITSKKNVSESLLRIGIMLETQMKLNARRKRIIDTGALINSIKHEIITSGTKVILKVGSFGVKYAAINEFGKKNVSDAQIRAMFFALSRKPRGKRGGNKGVVNVATKTWRPRPYIRPAYKGQLKEIQKELKGILERGL